MHALPLVLQKCCSWPGGRGASVPFTRPQHVRTSQFRGPPENRGESERERYKRYISYKLRSRLGASHQSQQPACHRIIWSLGAGSPALNLCRCHLDSPTDYLDLATARVSFRNRAHDRCAVVCTLHTVCCLPACEDPSGRRLFDPR